jgi:hypothetical protein|tara:strand:+ start:663 stop:914 length:252 start_codon:yes stop_codon:yes gene_type:complete
MLKRIVNVIWTYSLQDLWRSLWSKTVIDEKAEVILIEMVKRYKLTAQEISDVGKAIKEVGSQLGHVPKAVAGKTRKRKSKETK